MSALPSPVRRRPLLRNIAYALLVAGFTLGTIWRFTSWHERFGFHTLLEWGQVLEGHPWTPLVVMGVFILGGLLVFVHAMLLWVTVFTFSGMHAFWYCEMGSLASALVVYGLGRVLCPDVVSRMAGSHVDEISRALARKATLALILLHIFPICPYSVLNLLAGATHVSFKDYLAGTILGVTPGIIVLCLFRNSLAGAIEHPHWINVLFLVLFIAAGYVIFRFARKKYLPHIIKEPQATL